MPIANVKLSAQELSLVSDKEWMLAKRRIMEKAGELLGHVGDMIDHHQALQSCFSSFGLGPGSGKISRGENYRGYPYVVLDHPRIFERKDVFSLRSMCWWGHHMLISIHLEGKYLSHVSERCLKKSGSWPPGWFLCVHTDPWQHYFEPDNFIPVSEISSEDWFAGKNEKRFLRLAAKLDISCWNDWETWYEARLDELAGWLG